MTDQKMTKEDLADLLTGKEKEVKGWRIITPEEERKRIARQQLLEVFWDFVFNKERIDGMVIN